MRFLTYFTYPIIRITSRCFLIISYFDYIINHMCSAVLYYRYNKIRLVDNTNVNTVHRYATTSVMFWDLSDR